VLPDLHRSIFGPETITQLDEIITALETDDEVKVVVFDTAVKGLFLNRYDLLAKPVETTRLPPRHLRPARLQRLPGRCAGSSKAGSWWIS